MRRPLAVTGLLVALTATSATPQHSRTVGTHPKAPSQVRSLGNMSARSEQTFFAPSNLKRNTPIALRFWFDGSPLGNSLWLSSVHFGHGPFIDDDGELAQDQLDQDSRGWQTWFITNAHIRAGAMLWFYMTSDEQISFLCDADSPGYDPSVCPDDIPQVGISPTTLLTVGDAYEPGMFSSQGDPDPLGRDLVFQATFVTTPEPSTWILLGSGLAGVGLVAYRRKRRAADR